MVNLDTDIQYIKGVGPKRAQIFAKLGVFTAQDLLLFFPAYYQDRTLICPISQSLIKMDKNCIFGRIGKTYQKSLARGLLILDIEIFDDSGKMFVRFFRKQNPYSKFDIFGGIKNDFALNKYAYIYGDMKFDAGAIYMAVDDYEIVDNPTDMPKNFNRYMPVYPASEGLSQKVIKDSVLSALNLCKNLYPDISDIIPPFKDIQISHNSDSRHCGQDLQSPTTQCGLKTTEIAGQVRNDRQNNNELNNKAAWAIEKIHYPDNLQQAEYARRSFALQEFIVLESAIEISRMQTRKETKKQKYELKKNLLTPFRKNLKYSFTNGQKKAINEIFQDLQSEFAMNRMLMGDVGSGKTVVSLCAVLLAVENGYQTMIIAPTEILAEQHFAIISSMFEKLNIKTFLATSASLKRKKDREKTLAAIESAEAQVVVGTHSLIEDRIKFKNLSLIVVDEQHRFGVLQKFAALSKAENPDILMMTATPIPRALAMTVYGEMEVSTIEELPPGRIPISTFYTTEDNAYSKTIEELQKGSQAYIVYPIIDESDKTELKSATAGADELSKTVFKNFKVGLLHGRMKRDEKNEIMQKFKNKEFAVLIATTVIEVGIDIPNAAVMIIQNADRFGLSALHQLRGRIGRGSKKSYCYLVGGAKSDTARMRLKIMTSTNNGFEIAQEDLRMRGPGEFMGTIQHGFPEFKAGNLIKDTDIIEFSKDFAKDLIKKDPNLKETRNAVLRHLINLKFAKKLKLINVG
ncbi:MAG: ATP-dependent DNA helicase RecG [Elusimicrobiota bacterium]|jgi:ATP-dependent DNA helicase RecG|nr:ATP-dependent DNA helicase RecG [Elusimicrobiota bacterium]